jgi:hypothetical protein
MNRRNFIGLSAAASLSVARGAETAEKPLLSFGLITDVAICRRRAERRAPLSASLPKLKTAVEWLAKQNLPFTLHLGDLIDRDFKSFDAVLPLLGGLGHPVRHLLEITTIHGGGIPKAIGRGKAGHAGGSLFHSAAGRSVS